MNRVNNQKNSNVVFYSNNFWEMRIWVWGPRRMGGGSHRYSASSLNPYRTTLKPLYFEKLPRWPTLKILDFSWNLVRKIFAKVLSREISCLTAWRVPKSLGWPKTSKYDQITWLYILIKFNRWIKYWESLKSEPKKNRLEKGLLFGPP